PVTSVCLPASLTARDYTRRFSATGTATHGRQPGRVSRERVRTLRGASRRRGRRRGRARGGGGENRGGRGGGRWVGDGRGGGGGGGAERGGGVEFAGGGGGGGVPDTRLVEYGTEPRETGIWLPLAYIHCM